MRPLELLLDVLRDAPREGGHRALELPRQKDREQASEKDESLRHPVKLHPGREVQESPDDGAARDRVPKRVRPEGHREAQHGAGHENAEGLETEGHGLEDAAAEGNDSGGVQSPPQRYGSLGLVRSPLPAPARGRP